MSWGRRAGPGSPEESLAPLGPELPACMPALAGVGRPPPRHLWVVRVGLCPAAVHGKPR